MGKIKHKNGQVGSGVALNMIKANSSQPFSLKSSPVNQGDGKRARKLKKAVKTNMQVERMKKDGNIESVRLTPEGSDAANYAFDVTPRRLVTGLITERGVCDASEDGLRALFPEKD